MRGDDERDGSKTAFDPQHTHPHNTNPKPLDGGPAPLDGHCFFFRTLDAHAIMPPFLPPHDQTLFLLSCDIRGRETERGLSRAPGPERRKMRKRTSETTGERVTPRRAAPETRHVSIEPSRGTIHHHQTQHGTPRVPRASKTRVCATASAPSVRDVQIPFIGACSLPSEPLPFWNNCP